MRDLTPLPIRNIYKAKGPQKPQAWTRMSVAQLSAVAVPRLLDVLWLHTEHKAKVCISQSPGLGSNWPSSPSTSLPRFRLLWSHAGLNRGPYGYWPYALTS